MATIKQLASFAVLNVNGTESLTPTTRSMRRQAI